MKLNDESDVRESRGGDAGAGGSCAGDTGVGESAAAQPVDRAAAPAKRVGDIGAHVGQRLRQRRWMLGMTQQQVGDIVGIKFQQVQKYETGQNRVSAGRLWDLAKALDVPVSYFFDGFAESGATKSDSDLMAERETIDLIRAYYSIPEEPRRRLFELTKAMSDAANPQEMPAAAEKPESEAVRLKAL